MNTETPTERAKRAAHAYLQVVKQAETWLSELRSPQYGADVNARFVEWINSSPAYLLVFMDLVETEHKLQRLRSKDLTIIRIALTDAAAICHNG